MFGILTLIALAVFTLLYLSKSLQKKPEAVDKAVAAISAHLDLAAMIGVGYGLLAAVATLVTTSSGLVVLIHFAANLLLVAMALPFVFDKGVAKVGDKVNPSIVQEFKNMITWSAAQEKYLGYAGIVLCVLVLLSIGR